MRAVSWLALPGRLSRRNPEASAAAADFCLINDVTQAILGQIDGSVTPSSDDLRKHRAEPQHRCATVLEVVPSISAEGDRGHAPDHWQRRSRAPRRAGPRRCGGAQRRVRGVGRARQSELRVRVAVAERRARQLSWLSRCGSAKGRDGGLDDRSFSFKSAVSGLRLRASARLLRPGDRRP
jgi:hypothetical protein